MEPTTGDRDRWNPWPLRTLEWAVSRGLPGLLLISVAWKIAWDPHPIHRAYIEVSSTLYLYGVLGAMAGGAFAVVVYVYSVWFIHHFAHRWPRTVAEPIRLQVRRWKHWHHQ